MSSPLVIAVDVGNTAIKLGWKSDEGDGVVHHAIGLGSSGWEQSLFANIPQDPSQHLWVISSVNRSAVGILENCILERFPKDQWRVLRYNDVPLEISVRYPDRIGMDRLIGAWGALARISASSVIAVDVGSAVTVDLVRDNVFLGGAIFPGARLQFQALHAGTDQLPEVMLPKNSEETGTIEIPGRETLTAIQCGVILGIAGAIDRLVQEYQRQAGGSLPVVITGGDASLVRPYLNTESLFAKDAVLEAILRIATPS